MQADVLHVVGHDGRDDAAWRGASDPFVCDGQSQAARHRPALHRDGYFRVWLSRHLRHLGWLQPGRGNPAAGSSSSPVSCHRCSSRLFDLLAPDRSLQATGRSWVHQVGGLHFVEFPQECTDIVKSLGTRPRRPWRVRPRSAGWCRALARSASGTRCSVTRSAAPSGARRE